MLQWRISLSPESVSRTGSGQDMQKDREAPQEQVRPGRNTSDAALHKDTLSWFQAVVLGPVALLYLSAYLVQTQFVIHFLEKEISAIVTSLGILVNEYGGIALQYYLLPVLFFLGSKLGNVLFGFSDGIFSPEALFQIFKSAEALYVLGGRLTVFVAVTLLNIID